MAPVTFPQPTLTLEKATKELFDSLRDSWAQETAAYGDEEYAVAQIEHANKIVAEQEGGGYRPQANYGVYVLADDVTKCHGLAHFNRAMLPGTEGWTLRVVWVLLAPRYDYEEITDETAAWLIGGFVYAALQLCERGALKADHLKIHLQNRSDRRLAAYLVQSLEKPTGRTKVSVKGNWLHIENVAKS